MYQALKITTSRPNTCLAACQHFVNDFPADPALAAAAAAAVAVLVPPRLPLPPPPLLPLLRRHLRLPPHPLGDPLPLAARSAPCRSSRLAILERMMNGVTTTIYKDSRNRACPSFTRMYPPKQPITSFSEHQCTTMITQQN